jgi:hypothetical protein
MQKIATHKSGTPLGRCFQSQNSHEVPGQWVPVCPTPCQPYFHRRVDPNTAPENKNKIKNKQGKGLYPYVSLSQIDFDFSDGPASRSYQSSRARPSTNSFILISLDEVLEHPAQPTVVEADWNINLFLSKALTGTNKGAAQFLSLRNPTGRYLTFPGFTRDEILVQLINNCSIFKKHIQTVNGILFHDLFPSSLLHTSNYYLLIFQEMFARKLKSRTVNGKGIPSQLILLSRLLASHT